MCLAVPLKITKINGKDAIGESYGFKKNIRIDFIKDVKIGDYVIVHAGFAIEKIEEEVALENLKMIKEVADALGRIQ
ncbi:HypC/HybG/HupF family hydrogenase formation chaperone [Caloramator sp. E03]|uniref:HypC/HybG/HupF family hydrogenase formation chaperone n=1 Tax=Caloramator sp. E03 TaxID=2576307 RepID=UPI00111092C0|nr:HypC/HybG/HupF family hydrogenase formation chaperone [Caloramator sp. E03]QCX32610.1 HypC/HybG/HupF family hydrogenase formation chaperone [Caloramator sp. E03]